MDAPGTRRLSFVAPMVALAIAAALVAWHGLAWAAYVGSFGSQRLEHRVRLASVAAVLEPFSTEKRVRKLWLTGETELERGDYNAAVQTLGTAYRDAHGDRELLASFKRAQRTQALETVRKAHLQHGHEGPGGTLTPQDIER